MKTGVMTQDQESAEPLERPWRKLDPTQTTVEKKGNGRGFVWVKVKQHTYVNCYFTPNESIKTYEEKLDELEDFLREVTGDAIVAGNFNAKP